MPNRPNTPCRHPGCAALIPYGTKYCEVHKPLHPEEVRSASDRGYGKAWQKARKRYLEAHPFCVECMKEGQVRHGNRCGSYCSAQRRQGTLLG